MSYIPTFICGYSPPGGGWGEGGGVGVARKEVAMGYLRFAFLLVGGALGSMLVYAGIEPGEFALGVIEVVNELVNFVQALIQAL